MKMGLVSYMYNYKHVYRSAIICFLHQYIEANL